MRVLATTVESAGPGQLRVITTIDLDPGTKPIPKEEQLGEGPTGDAIPDKIVRCLVAHTPASVTLAEIQKDVGGNPATVNRQAWTLASNAPDLQRRLRGWVVSPERGLYALSPQARERLRS